MSWRFFFVLLMALSVGFGYWMGQERAPKREPLSFDPNREMPIVEYKSFVFVVHSYQQSDWCLRSLSSLCEQDYDRFRIVFFDDGSNDGTLEKVQAFIEENHQEHRISLIHNPESLGNIACLYRTIHELLHHEIVIPLDAKDWLAHPGVLNRLNAAYQNPDVWLTSAKELLYPSYEMGDSSQASFYAALFQQIRLSDLMVDGHFFQGRDAYLTPIIQMAGGRERLFQEPLFVGNSAACSRKWTQEPLSSYPFLSQFPMPQEKRADLLIFSSDRPLQLYACLESVQRYFSGYEQIYVLCRANDARYRSGYAKVQRAFPDVRWIYQSSEPKKDFKPLLLQTLFDSPSEYIVFGVDDQIATDFADLKECMEMMEKTKAYGFYLRLGKHITHSYQCGKDQAVPRSVCLKEGEIYGWNLKSGYSDWDFPNTLDMTLYRKKDLKTPFEKMRYKTPNSLEFCWAKEAHLTKEIGLYFAHSKVVNTPLNIVGRTGNPHMQESLLSIEELLAKFEQGLKIDIDPLYRIDNTSPHIEHYPEFALR